ncbi:hypothetical protein PVAP13_9NG686514 [Panicum virgatum]|uniref:Uncharacterized protein n=1 Tax=Panicum virgatum TaxID=38727 RepID=A0A8T0MYB0_PANVG|nr:hypothetical protein PVAP13_9NG686514 [Panicum virgatum]
MRLSLHRRMCSLPPSHSLRRKEKEAIPLSPLSAHLHTREQAEQAAPGACPRARGGPGLRRRSARPCGRRWPVPHTACWPRVRGCAAPRPGLRRAGSRGRRPAARGSQLGAPRAAPLRRLRSSRLDLRPAGPRSGGRRVPGLGQPGMRLLRAAARSRSISSIAAELRRLGLRPLLLLLPVSFHGGGAGGRLRGGDTAGLARSGGLELGPWRRQPDLVASTSG